MSEQQDRDTLEAVHREAAIRIEGAKVKKIGELLTLGRRAFWMLFAIAALLFCCFLELLMISLMMERHV